MTPTPYRQPMKRRISEEEVRGMSPAELRLHEAEFFLERYREACGSPQDSYFAMIADVDAFLWALWSVREMPGAVPMDTDAQTLLGALRDLTTHRGVIASPTSDRPFVRIVNEGGPDGASAELHLDVLKCSELLERAASFEKRFERRYLTAEKPLLRMARASPRIPLEPLMREALEIQRRALSQANGEATLPPSP